MSHVAASRSRCPDHVGAPALLATGTPHHTSAPIDSATARKTLAGHVARGSSHDLAHEMSVRVGVVGVPRSRLPPRFGRRQRAGHALPIPQVVVRSARSRIAGTPARWHERVPHRGSRLARGRELRPHRRDRVVECDDAGIDQLQREQRRRTPCRPSRSSTSVSGCHGRAALRCRTIRPTRSTTTLPSTITHTAAPTSPRSAKLAANASRTDVECRLAPSVDWGRHGRQSCAASLAALRAGGCRSLRGPGR